MVPGIPEPRADYAREILQTIADVRLMQQLGHLDVALKNAVRLGWLLAEMTAKHDWPAVPVGRRAIIQRRAAAGHGTARLREIHEARSARFRSDVDAYFARNPTHSCHTAAQNLSRHRKTGPAAIKALAKRIARHRRRTK